MANIESSIRNSLIGNRQSAIGNPKSKIQNPKSKIQNPKWASSLYSPQFGSYLSAQ